MSKHTPGPWRVRSCQTAVLIDAARNGEAMLIALVADNDTEGDTETDRKLSNARLMAAAPAMYEALQKILAVKRTVDLNLFNIEEIHSIAEAALRAADGGE